MSGLDATGACPCQSGRRYADCCRALHEGGCAADAVALMRSRYSAFVRKDERYLRASWHASTRPDELDLRHDETRWLGLRIVAHGSDGPDRAWVEFIARFRHGGTSAQRLHERSRFVREQLHWYYVDGEFLDT